MMSQILKTKAVWLTVVMIVPTLVVLGAIGWYHRNTNERTNRFVREDLRSRVEMVAACRARILYAEGQAQAAIKRRAAEFAEFIQSRGSNIEAFSREVISWYGKWRVVHSHLPFTDKEGHQKYVVQLFTKHFFSAPELSDTVKRSTEDALRDIEAVENELAVALRQEILGRTLSPAEIRIATDGFKRSIERLVAASQWDAAKSAGSVAVSEVAAQVATQILVRLGISAGILATGAANSWWSFGGALVVGIGVDLIWEWLDDPAGDIAQEMRAALDELAAQGSAAIREEMTKMLATRRDLWLKTIPEMLP